MSRSARTMGISRFFATGRTGDGKLDEYDAIGKPGSVFLASPEALSVLRSEFERQHYLKFPRLLSTELIDFVRVQLDEAHLRTSA